MIFCLKFCRKKIPARMQARAIADLRALICDGFAGAGLDIGAVRAFITPRRMALVISGVAGATPDVTEERKGPRIDAPEHAVNGFLGSVGLTRDQVEERPLKKGVFCSRASKNRGGARGTWCARCWRRHSPNCPGRNRCAGRITRNAGCVR